VTLEIRDIRPDDGDRLQAFFRGIPESDRTFFKEDVLDPETVRGWAEEPRGRRRLVAVDGDRIAGYVAVLPGVSLSRHVGEVRLVVAPGERGRGLGRELARRIVVDAVKLGLTKLTVEVVAEQEAAIRMFRALGFVAEALLRDHLRDRDGKLHDLIVLSHFVEDNWSEMLTAGFDDALTKDRNA
jgi:L-amino acid N-acyltransferase YncA